MAIIATASRLGTIAFDGRRYRLVVTQAGVDGMPQTRCSSMEYLVSFEQLSPTLQKLNKRGGKIVSLTPA
ncbi:phycobilisome linker polypeptide [Synechococcus sp. PCC 7336]|uniref:phycobilisome linker polypeptide n=1 Tax=Synechococcus sp. PCC 7336 TaxID=195250 RepID=UPI000349F69D|nr:phycobilisome linker polypeptide [Synechococcus sp. PCC 7336]